MSTPHSKTRTDRDDLEQIADALAEALNYVSDMWPTDGDLDQEIDKLHGHVAHLSGLTTTLEAQLRELQIRRIVRAAWPQAFAAGSVAAHEDEPDDSDQLNMRGVAEAIHAAETECREAGWTPVVPAEVLAENIHVKLLDDAVFSRIMETESSRDEPENQNLETERSRRATAVVKVFMDAVVEGSL